jgi:carboxymethylenebutenolidase
VGETIELAAADGHAFDAYVAHPTGAPKGAVVVVQEIFGVNGHIRSVADRFAAAGYVAVAPALFDRYERQFDVGYDKAGSDRGMAILRRFKREWALADTRAAIEYARRTYDVPVAVVGFCLGGSIAWLAAAEVPLAAAVGYYGGQITSMNDRVPQAPVMLHFGGRDAHIPRADIEAIRAAHPEVEVYVYDDAGHGFNCDARESYAPQAARQAWERTLAFLARYVRD